MLPERENVVQLFGQQSLHEVDSSDHVHVLVPLTQR